MTSSRLQTAESGAGRPATAYLIRKAAVLGAGTMGSRIAAHLANAGLPVVLLDIPAEKPPRSAVAAQAVDGLKKSKPAAFYDPTFTSRLTVGNFDDDLALLRDCDWVIEAVTENLAIKQALLAKVTTELKPDAILTTNTSGLPVAQIAAVLPEALRRRWFGTHFFNPPRYMRLVEIIAPPEADPAAVAAIRQFADQRLGKDVVFARDTPNFIANRIGVFVMLETVRLMREEDLSIEEVDVLTGTAIGWPRTGTFRLADLVGIDVLAHVARNFPQGIEVPAFIQTMLERQWLGDKTGQGFYRKQKDPQGGDVRLALNWKTLEYAPASKAKLPSVEMAKSADRLSDRLGQLLSGDTRKDKGVRFHWRLLTGLWNYAANCLPEIADSVADIDRAMRAGFNWEMGPFELWDAAGFAKTLEGMRSMGSAVSEVAARLESSGGTGWYRNHGKECFDPATVSYRPIPQGEGVGRVADFRASHGVVRQNPGASLVDLGDGVACLELHSKKDAIGEDIVRMVTDTLRADSAAVRDFHAFVLTSDSHNFSVGANLMQLLLSAQEGEWDEVDLMVRAFQKMTAAIRFCPCPVIVAPFGFCFGGGAEIALHAVHRQVHAELYMGLVETGVGILPAGGGCKEMVLRSIDPSGILQETALRRHFETIAMAKVSTSALEARRLDFIEAADRITMNRERLLHDAKEFARDVADAGYAAPIERKDIPAPGQSLLATFRLGVRMMREGEYISDHDVKVADKVAHVLCGGEITPGVPVSEQYFLDLEREAFLSLCGEKKTQERIAFTLKTGKPLRN
ncbi:MAG TPA: 3-hydroxyacyl-CoA dehydrogenase NAD-binding domain-containing protein [Bryobacteraceae bacterium]|nr:3-hydroxyacyl-CoA dehydrogenase NAD-binding domain-containing protein [Bryobacteraceae bacterium]